MAKSPVLTLGKNCPKCGGIMQYLARQNGWSCITTGCGAFEPAPPPAGEAGQRIRLTQDPDLELRKAAQGKQVFSVEQDVCATFIPKATFGGKSAVVLWGAGDTWLTAVQLTSVNFQRIAGFVSGGMVKLGEMNVVRDQPMAIGVDAQQPLVHLVLETPQKNLCYTTTEARKIAAALVNAAEAIDRRGGGTPFNQ